MNNPAGFDNLLQSLLEPLMSSGLSLTVSDATDAESPLISVNEAFCELTGYRESDVVGRNCRFLQGPGTDRSEVVRLRQSVRNGEAARVVLMNYRRDGSPFLNELILTPVRDGTGRLRYFTGIQRELPSTTVAVDAARRIRFALLPDATLSVLACPNGVAPGWISAMRGDEQRRLAHAAASVVACGAGVALSLKIGLTGRDGTTHFRQLKARPRIEPEGCVFDGTLSEGSRDTDLQSRLHWLEAVAANANDGIIITEAAPFDEPGPRIVYVNQAVERQTGYTSSELIGRTPRILQGAGTDRAETARLGSALRLWKSTTAQLLNYRKDGTTFWSELSMSPVADRYGWWTNYVSVQRDVTERRTASDRVAYLANHDPLTGLANRRIVSSCLHRALLGAGTSGTGCGAVRIDLDRFKLVNDTFGHAAGDAVLIETAARLRRCSRAADTVAREGGDEFVVVLPGLDGRDTLGVAAERIRAAVCGPFLWNGEHLQISASVGAGYFPQDAGNADDLLAAADVALYQAKREGGGRAALWSAGAHAIALPA